MSDTDSKGQDNEVDVDEADIDVPDDPSTSEDASEGEEDDHSIEFNPLIDRKSNYPEWSWDHVRTYVAIRRDEKYSNEQIRALSAQDIVMLEKYNGHVTYGTVEKGTLRAAKRIKAINPKVKILFYLNAMVRMKYIVCFHYYISCIVNTNVLMYYNTHVYILLSHTSFIRYIMMDMLPIKRSIENGQWLMSKITTKDYYGEING